MHAKTFLLVVVFLCATLATALPVPHGRRNCGSHARAAKKAQEADNDNDNDFESTIESKAPKATSTHHIAAEPSASQSEDVPVASSKPHSVGPTSNGPTGRLASLFPLGGTIQKWTTSTLATNPLPLADSTFHPTDVLKALTPQYVTAPDGKHSLHSHYPKGSVALQHAPYGGVSFYAPGPKEELDLTDAKEATFGYSVLFEEGFEFNLGGKLPGLYGGDSASTAISCSGGRRSTDCWSARLMWRPKGQGELYTYLPSYTNPEFAANKKLCNVAPHSDCNPTYGASVGRGAFKFEPGTRTTVSQRLRLNDVGKANGELELFVGGKSVINVSGLKFRDSEAGRIRGIQMQSFFGGHEGEWASPKAQSAYFSDFSLAITENL